MEAAKGNRWGHRDATMVLVAYRHGLRVSELVDLRWEQVDFRTATLHVRRVKKGTPSTHPILGDELRALRRLQREQEPKSPFVFTSERGAPFTTAGFARMVERAGSERKLASKPACTCCGMPAAMRSPTRDHRCNSCYTVILELIEYHSQPHAIPTKLLIYDGQGFGLVNVRQSSAVRQLPIDHAHRNTIALVCPGHGIARPTTVGVRPT